MLQEYTKEDIELISLLLYYQRERKQGKYFLFLVMLNAHMRRRTKKKVARNVDSEIMNLTQCLSKGA